MKLNAIKKAQATVDLKPVGHDRKGPFYSVEDVVDGCLKMINTDCFFEYKVAHMTNDVENAIKKTNTVVDQFKHSLDRFTAVQADFAAQSKQAAGAIKDSSERMAQGIARVEKAANFDRLERYVILLERASAAMGQLADLEAEGKLEKIANALK